MINRKGTMQNQCAATSRLDRRLVEIHEYAQREGITPEDIKKCSDIGILHLRHHKGKTFVVDMPVCSYENSEQIDTEVGELLGLIKSPNEILPRPEQSPVSPKKSSKEKKSSASPSLFGRLFDKLFNQTVKTSAKKEKKTESPKPDTTAEPHTNQNIEPGSISQLVEEMLAKAEKMKNSPENTNHPKTPLPITEIPRNPKRKLSRHTEELLHVMYEKLDEMERREN